jgi:uncharacterized protein YjbI with pentapeptide repeats
MNSYLIILIGCLAFTTQVVASNEVYVERLQEISRLNADNLADKLTPHKNSKIQTQWSNQKVALPLAYDNAQISDVFHAEQSEFANTLSFQLSRFEQGVLTPGSIFYKDINFQWAQLSKNTVMSYSVFKGTVNFYNAIFLGKEANFYGVTFDQSVWFKDADFKSPTDFSDAKFAGDLQNTNQVNADFQNAVFRDTVKFNGANFSTPASFSNVTFQDNVNFSNATFGYSVNFSNASFNGKTNFYNTKLPVYLDFSHIIHINNKIDLTTTSSSAFGERTKINLVNSRIDKILINYNQFELYFPDNASHKQIAYVYESLLNSFKNRGLNKDYRELYIEYEHYKYDLNEQSYMALIQDWWWDYGFAKERIFIWIGAIIGIFTLINNLFIMWLMRYAFEVSFLTPYCQNTNVQDNRFVQFMQNIPVSLIYTTVIFFGSLLGFKREFTYFKNHHILVNVYLFTIMVTGLVCAMFILNFLVK